MAENSQKLPRDQQNRDKRTGTSTAEQITEETQPEQRLYSRAEQNRESGQTEQSLTGLSSSENRDRRIETRAVYRYRLHQRIGRIVTLL